MVDIGFRAVHRGAKFLDRVDWWDRFFFGSVAPPWYWRVNIRRLDIPGEGNDVLTQSRVPAATLSYRRRVLYGLVASPILNEREYCRHWAGEIAKRRGALSPRPWWKRLLGMGG